MSETKTTASPAFPPTRWSLVLAAREGSAPEMAAAFETVCVLYWQPLYAFVRRCGRTPHDAEDLTQGFFRSLLEKRWLEQADQEKGRLRSFLILAMKRFMTNEGRNTAAQKRGGGEAHLPIDTAFAESYYRADESERLVADQVFDREWALTLLRLATQRLEAEFKDAAQFQALKGFLTAAHDEIDYNLAAAKLKTTVNAARVAVHRFRKRFRAAYREEVAQTLPPSADVEGEVRYLANVLAEN